jgi:hypothetical protein
MVEERPAPLSWIICSFSPSLVSSVYGLDTSHQAWTSLAAIYASESKSRVSHLKRQLQSLQQGRKTCIEYLKLAKELADELAAVRKPVEHDDLISFVVSGLNSLFNTFVTVHSFTARNTEMSFANFQSELLNHEMLLENQQHKTVTLETGIFALYTNKQALSTSILPTSTLPISKSQDSHQDLILATNTLLPKTTMVTLQVVMVVIQPLINLHFSLLP